MKLLFFSILFLLLSIFSFSQVIDSTISCFPLKEGKVFVEKVDTVSELSKDLIYKKVRAWFSTYYRNSNAVIKMEDKDAGQITGTGVFYIYILTGADKGDHPCRYNINVECKEGKYRVQLTDFKFDNSYDLTTIESVNAKNKKWIKANESLCTFFRIETRKIYNSLKEAVGKNDDF